VVICCLTQLSVADEITVENETQKKVASLFLHNDFENNSEELEAFTVRSAILTSYKHNDLSFHKSLQAIFIKQLKGRKIENYVQQDYDSNNVVGYKETEEEKASNKKKSAENQIQSFIRSLLREFESEEE